jgi:hypothetical protein
MRWRPKFLKCLAMATGIVFAAKVARVSYRESLFHCLLVVPTPMPQAAPRWQPVKTQAVPES